MGGPGQEHGAAVKRFLKWCGIVALGLAAVFVYLNSNQQQANALGYLFFGAMVVWGIIDHINKKLAFLAVEIDALRRKVDSLSERVMQVEIDNFQPYTTRERR